MIRIAQYIAGLALLVLYVPGSAFAADSIKEFTSDITVQQDGTFEVVETIIYDFGDAQRHGIFRTIPLEHSQEASVWYKKRYIEVEVSSVTIDGNATQYTDKVSEGEINIKIGDPDRTITGEHTYVIKYSVAGGLTYTDEKNPDLYWNATGNDWPGSMLSTHVSVSGPVGSLRNEQACYRGRAGETKACDSILLDGDIVLFTSSNLSAGEGITIAQSLNGSLIQENIIERVPFYISMVPFLFTFLGWLLYRGYRFNTAHDTEDTIIAQYEPYPGVLPMYSGVVVDGKLDPKDITAGILHLAQEGFLKIKKTQKKVMFLFEVDDYEVTLLQDAGDAPTSFHKEILSMLFPTGEEGEVTSLGELKKNTSQQKKNYQTLQNLKSAINEDLLEQGFFESAFKLQKNYVIGSFAFLALLIYLSFKYGGELGVVLVFVLLMGVGIIFASMVYRRRTVQGYKAKRHIKGFKEFLSVTDKERFAFHDAPEKSPQLFMQYLPYAVALGVEEKWAKVFKDISIASPDWYEDSAHGTFAASSLTRDIGAFSSSFASSSGTAPSSGGGTSGGGSGGGGGGSW